MSITRSDDGTTTGESSSPPQTSAPESRGSGFTLWVTRLHFLAGLFVGPFLLIAAVTGGLYAISPTAEQWVYRDYLHTESSGPPAPISDQIAAARTVLPNLALNAVRPATEPGETTRVMFSDPDLGESERRAVFIDPVTTVSQGSLVVYGSSGSLPMRTWISQLHRHLHLGEPGRIYSELAASWLWVIALGGLFLWIRRYRMRHPRPRFVTPDRSATGRNRMLSWHGAVGVWIIVGLVFLSATGLTWSRFAGENIGELRTTLNWTTPTVTSSLVPGAPEAAGHGGHGGAIGPPTTADDTATERSIAAAGSALATARAMGVSGPVEVSLPSDPDTAIVIAQTRGPFRFATNTVAVDPADGHVVDFLPFSAWPLAAKLTTWGIALHMGLLFGLANQIALLGIAIGLVIVIVRGYQMWWTRRPRRASSARRLPRAPLRGTLRRLTLAQALTVVIAAVLLGWYVPLLGLSLLAFITIDVGIGLAARRRSTSPSTTSLHTLKDS